MVRWTIVMGAAVFGGAATYFLARTYFGFMPTDAAFCAAVVTLGVGVIAHMNTLQSEDFEDSIE